jgi:cation:H+ antiporter
MTVAAAQFVGGLFLLLLGARLLVAASIDAAQRLQVAPLLVGLTLVAWGTSAPELALNLISAFKGRSDLALGNVVGANICNMSLVLGACAMIRPLAVGDRLVRVELLLNAAILVFMAGLGLTRGFTRWEAAVMLGVFVAYTAWSIRSARRGPDRAGFADAPATLGEDPTPGREAMSWTAIVVGFLGGLALLSIGGSLASDGASAAALAWGVPATVVGLTVVSIGTTLPELATSLTAVRKGQTDLALGNAIGSCLFNAGAIFGITGAIAPPTVDGAMPIALAAMALLAAALVPISRARSRTVSRAVGVGLVAFYALTLAAIAVRSGR